MKIPYVRAIIPLLLGYLLFKYGCMPPLTPTPTTDPSQVSPPIFDVKHQGVLIVILLLTGIAWEMSYQKGSKHTVDTGFLVLLSSMYWWFWLYCHGESSKAGMVLILVAALTAVMIWKVSRSLPRVSLLLVPLMVWILVAEHLPSIPQQVILPLVTVDLPHVSFHYP